MAGNTITVRSHEELVRLAALENPGFLAYLQGGVNLATNGLVYTGYISPATAAGHTEGTMIAGSGANTLVALTGDTLSASPISVERHQMNSLDFSGANFAGWAEEGAGILMTAWQNNVIAALKAASITNVGTLPTGQLQFIAESDSEQLLNENQLNIPLARVKAAGGYKPSEVAIIMPSQCWENLSAGRSYVQASQTRIDDTGEFPKYRGSTIFVVPGDDDTTGGATNWGGNTSGEEVAFIVGRKGYSFHSDGPRFVRNITDWNVDGFYRVVYEMAAFHGIRHVNHLGQVVNV